MIRILLILTALTFAGCAQTPPAPQGPGPVVNQPHLPPPGFPPISQPGDAICGGMMGGTCSVPGEFCYRPPEAQCGAADQTGICRPKPEVCTMDYNPVCGCDGRSYPNECAANSAGVSAAYRGECRS